MRKVLMKAMVIYDSVFGNTAHIAQAIGDGFSNGPAAPEDVELRKIGDVTPEQLVGLDVLIVGSPTRSFRPTPATSDFLKSIPKNALKGVKVAAFDTRFTEEEIHSQGFLLSNLVNVFGYAAEPIGDRLKKKGGEPVMPPEGFYVDGTEGPLTEGELERAADWARQILAK
jgi:flavodoxin